MSDNKPDAATAMNDCWNRIGVWSQTRASCPELERYVHCRNCKRYSAAGRSMLQRPVPAEYRAQWTERYSETKLQQEDDDHSVLLFRLGDEWLAIDSGFVDEISEMRTIHTIPHRSNSLIKGLVNCRGELKICVSMGTLLQLEKARAAHTSDHEILERMVYVSSENQSFVFPVSEVHGIHHYSDISVKPAPATVSKSKQSFATGVITWDQRNVGLLDTELLFYAMAKGLQ